MATAQGTRIAVLAQSAHDAAALGEMLGGLGHTVATSSDWASAAALVRARRPAVAVISGDAPSPKLRALAQRVRDAAEGPLPVLFALPESAWWLRAPQARDLAPFSFVRRSGLTEQDLAGALQTLGVGSDPPTRTSTLSLDATRRRLEGPSGAARLTPAEGALAAAFLGSAGRVLGLDTLCDAVWGDGAHDSARAVALRTHVYGLRRTLQQVGAGDVLVTEPGRGYRLASS
jgi:hypothetical protein